MKLVSLVLAVLVSASVTQAAVLKNLNCAATNGLVIVTVAQTETGLDVAAQYGVLARAFHAELATTKTGETAVTLKNPYALEYTLALPLDVASEKAQETKGQLQTVVQEKVVTLADIVCKVELK